MILAGDTGGTKTRLALYDFTGGKLRRMQTEQFVSREHATLEEIVRPFLVKHHVSVSKACFGVPGPVVNGKAVTTNLPWALDEKHLAGALNIPAVTLVNDLVATIAAAPLFTDDDLLVLHQSKQTDRGEKMFGILAPGTGLGQAFLFYHAGQPQILASEGGHADFAPTTEIELELLRYLMKKFARVSWERVLSGPGLVNIYNFLKETGVAPEPPALSKRLREKDPAAVIASAGLAGEYEICERALDIFASILGAQAGNLVLTLMASGGLYLGGGIPPKICQKLADGTTVDSYVKKGRLSNIVEQTPLYVIRDDYAALLGAAHLATTI